MASPSISIDLGIAEIIERLHKWWKDVVTRGDTAKDQATRTSVQKLAVCLVRMAGFMDTFADQLERSTVNLEDISRITHNLNLPHLVRSMRETLAEIEAALKTISLDWAVVNLGVLDNASSLAGSPGVAVAEADGIVATLRDGQTTSINTRGWRDMAQVFRSLSEQGRQIAEEITKTIKADRSRRRSPRRSRQTDRGGDHQGDQGRQIAEEITKTIKAGG
jgi:hypothetical protein